jgi:predicted nucleotidyltransferase
MPLQIEDKYLEIVKQILHQSLFEDDNTDIRVYVFGSRARNNAKKYSDIDLAVDYNHTKLPFKIEARLAAAFEDSLLPYRVDIIDLTKISAEFRKKIDKDLVRIK